MQAISKRRGRSMGNFCSWDLVDLSMSSASIPTYIRLYVCWRYTLCCCTNNCCVPTRKYIRTASFSYLCEWFTIVPACQGTYSLRWRHCDLLLVDWSVWPWKNLNYDFVTFSNWFSSNLLTLNISKCNFVIFGNSRKHKLVNNFSRKLNSTAIEKSNSF